MEGIWTILVLLSSILGFVFAAKAPPPVLDVEATSSTSINIQWKPPSTTATIIKWRLQYLEVGQKKKQKYLNGDLREYVLDGLKPETDYRIRMLAQTSDRGTGRPSDWIEITTLSDTPVVETPTRPTLPGSPRNLAAEATANTARVTWDPPRDNGAPVLGYIIHYGPRDNPRENILSVDLQPRQKNLEGLSSSVQYRVTLTAFNTEGQSSPATVDFFTMAEEIVKGPPPEVENIQYESPSPTSVRVTWTLPETTELNVIESIILGIGDEGAGFKRLQTTNLQKGATSHTIENLTPETRYAVMVVTENKYGESRRVPLTVETIAIPPTTPAPIPVPVTSTPEEEEMGPPPQVENVQFSSLSDSSVEISWTLPATTSENEIELIGVGFGAYGIPAQFLPVSDLERTAVRYVADDVTPGSRYSAMVVTRNQFGRSDPVVITVDIPNETGIDESSESEGLINFNESEEVFYLEVPSDVHAEVLTTTSLRLSFIDPTLDDQTQETVEDRYYTVRYKSEDATSFQYLHLRRTNDIVRNLAPETNYQFEIKVVKGVNGHSLYSLPVSVFTRDPDHANQVQDVTVVQMRVLSAQRVSAIVNWIPPINQPQQITGYVLEYLGERPTANSTWEKVNVNSVVPSAKIEHLSTSNSYHVRVAPVMGELIGDFSNPPDVFTTPAFSSGQPTDECGTEPTTEQIIARVNWMRSEGPVVRTALLGVPLPYCDDYYARHECHGLVCFCIPGKRPASSPACANGVQGDQPSPGSSRATPCRVEYELAMREIDEARTAGKPLNDAHLPYCTEDGYYQSKQCIGSMCYCSTRDGRHAGKEVPIWKADTLNC